MCLMILLTVPVSASARDAVEDTLAREINRSLDAIGQQRDLPERDRAYLRFLDAVYQHDPPARQEAEDLYRQLSLPESQAFLGSLAILKARDLSERSLLSGIWHVFTEHRLVSDGITQLDAATSAHPDNVDIRVVRAVTYLQLPSIFRKFDTGLGDIQLVLKWIEENKVSVPKEDRLFRDQTSLYYYAGRYLSAAGEPEQARTMFIRSSQSSSASPFAQAARQRLGGS